MTGAEGPTRSNRQRGLSDSEWLVRGAAGIVAYLALAALPVLFMLVPPLPPARTFLREFSVALGFAGLALLGLQLVLTARLRRIKAPYGIDAVYYFHRIISIVAFALVAAHPVLLVVEDASKLALFNVFTAPPRARFAVLALVLTAVLLVASFFRTRLRLGYELWRRTHGLMAVVMLAAAVAHVELVGHYVSTPAKHVLWIVYPALWTVALLWARVVKPAVMWRRPWSVAGVRPERGSAWTLTLKREGERFEFAPGQFVWLHLGATPFAMAEHPFSISSSAERTESVELTIKELGDFTSTIGDTPIGERAWIDGPYGQFSMDRHRADGYVFIAGGVGITPIMSMLRTAADRGDTRPFLLIYGVSSLDEATFADELTELEERIRLRVVLVPARPPDGWEGESGFVTRELLERHIGEELSHAEYFVCGPEPMMRSVSESLEALDVPAQSVRYELFGLV